MNIGDKVKCISRTETPWSDNGCLLEVGRVYTIELVDDSERYGKLISLEEINIDHGRMPNFSVDDFVLYEEDDPNEAWDRAMGIL